MRRTPAPFTSCRQAVLQPVVVRHQVRVHLGRRERAHQHDVHLVLVTATALRVAAAHGRHRLGCSMMLFTQAKPMFK